MSSPDVFDKKYPLRPCINSFNPFAIETWEYIARKGGELTSRQIIVLGRGIGAAENPDYEKTFIGGPIDPVREIPAYFELMEEGNPPDDYNSKDSVQVINTWQRLEADREVPPNGYYRDSMENLSYERYLRVELDLHAPESILLKGIKSRVKIYQKKLNLYGRNREEAIKYLSMFFVNYYARGIGKSPQKILYPRKFKIGRRTEENGEEWDVLKKDFDRAHRESNRIFKRVGLPRVSAPRLRKRSSPANRSEVVATLP